jgi:tetratricopeptide (TPR) repeat protein
MENKNQTSEQAEQAEVIETKPSPLHTVTPLSKYLAMALFIIMPFIGGWIGYTYAPEKIVEVSEVVVVEKDIEVAVNIETIKQNTKQLENLLNKESPNAADIELFQTIAADAITTGESLIDREPNNPDVWTAIGNIYSVGVQAGIEDSYNKSLEYLTKAQQLDPQNATTYLNLAKLEARNSDYIQAETFINKALELDRKNTDILFLASDIATAQDNYNFAKTFIEELIIIEPNNPDRYSQLGALEAAMGNTEAAIVDYETAAKLEPDSADRRFILGYLYFVGGRLSEAEVQIQAVIDMNEENTQAEELLQQIQEAQ